MPSFGGGTVGGAVVNLLLNDAGFKRGLAQAEGKLKGFGATGTGSN